MTEVMLRRKTRFVCFLFSIEQINFERLFCFRDQLPEHDVCLMQHEQHWMYYQQMMAKHFVNVVEMLVLLVEVKSIEVIEV